jgi:hypothetical protein
MSRCSPSQITTNVLNKIKELHLHQFGEKYIDESVEKQKKSNVLLVGEEGEQLFCRATWPYMLV